MGRHWPSTTNSPFSDDDLQIVLGTRLCPGSLQDLPGNGSLNIYIYICQSTTTNRPRWCLGTHVPWKFATIGCLLASGAPFLWPLQKWEKKRLYKFTTCTIKMIYLYCYTHPKQTTSIPPRHRGTGRTCLTGGLSEQREIQQRTVFSPKIQSHQIQDSTFCHLWWNFIFGFWMSFCCQKEYLLHQTV